MKFQNRFKYIALGVLGLIAVMLLIMAPAVAIAALAFVPIAGLTDQENALVKAIQDQFEVELEKVKKGYISAEKAEEILNAKIAKMQEGSVTSEQLTAAIKEFNDKLVKQWEEVAKLTTKENKSVVKRSFRDAVKETIINSENVEKYTDGAGNERYRIKGLNSPKAEVEFKVAVDMNTANAVRPGGSPGMSIGSLTDYGMTQQQLPLTMDTHFIGAFASQTTTEKYFGVIIEGTETDGSDVKAETSVAGDSSYLFSTKEFKVFDFAVKFRVHQNTLDDIDNVMSRIETIGVDRLMSKIDYYVLGSAGDNSATPYGILNAGYFTAYDTTLRAGEVVTANIVNVIKNGVLQARKLNRSVDTVLLNSSDAAEIEDLKDANSNTVALAGIRLDATGKLAYIYGLRVLINDKVTTNTFVLCNYAESIQFGIREDMGVRMGYDQTTDFSKKIVTIQIEARLAIGIGHAETIIYCSDIAAAATALSVV